MAFNNFDQFEIIRILPIHPFGNLDISITNSTIFMFIVIILFYVLFTMENKKGLIVPTRWQSIIEIIYEMVYNMVKENIGTSNDKTRFFPFVFVLFISLALMNMFGLVPYTFTPTSHIAVTFGLSLSIFIGCTIIGFSTYKLDFFAMFMPAGAPLWLAPFLVIIELISHCAKAISLGVRLAANITAGHLLFAILSGFTWNMIISGGLLSLISIFPLFIVLFITVLEMAVALIQAYVFSLLTTIYINDSVNLH
jgi:ATP synthase subunit 6